MCGKGQSASAATEQKTGKQAQALVLQPGLHQFHLLHKSYHTKTNNQTKKQHSCPRHHKNTSQKDAWVGWGCFPPQRPSLCCSSTWLPDHVVRQSHHPQGSPGTRSFKGHHCGFCLPRALVSPCMNRDSLACVLHSDWKYCISISRTTRTDPFIPSPCSCHCIHKLVPPHHWCPDHSTVSACFWRRVWTVSQGSSSNIFPW